MKAGVTEFLNTQSSTNMIGRDEYASVTEGVKTIDCLHQLQKSIDIVLRQEEWSETSSNRSDQSANKTLCNPMIGMNITIIVVCIEIQTD